MARRIAAAARALDADSANRNAAEELQAGLAEHASILMPVILYLKSLDPGALNLALSRGDADYAAVAALMRQHVERLDRALAAATAAYQRASRAEGLRVEVWAIHYSARRQPVQVHVEGYDNLPAGDPSPVDKLGFSRTPAEQADLDRSMGEYRQLVATIGQFRTQTANLGQELESLFRSASNAVQSLAGAIDSLPVQQDLTKLAATLTSARQAPEVATRLQALADIAALTDRIRSLHATLVQGLRAGPTPESAPDLLGGVLRQLKDAIALLTELAGRPEVQRGFGMAVQALKTAATTGLQRTQGEARALIEGLIRDSMPKWEGVRQSLETLGRQYTAVRDRLDWFGNVLKLVGVATTLGSTDVSADPARELIAQSADDLRPGTLDLSRIEPLDGDRVVLTLRLFEGHSGRTLAQQTSTVHIRTYGWHRRWSGGLAFTRESRADGVLPGVSASWIVHYRSEPRIQADGSQRDGRTLPLDVGFGLTSVVITRNSEVQLGFGPVVSFFGDALVLGAGYNLQRQQGYAILATPLLDLVNRVSRAGQ